MTWFVYALRQPGTDEIRYIGKSDDPVSRARAHMSDRSSEAMREWMRSIRYRPVLDILEEHPTEDLALQAEERLVSEHWSGRLLNSFSQAGVKPGKKRVRFEGFGFRLHETRKSKGLTMQQLQEMTGIGQSAISKIERSNSAAVEAATAHLLAKALGVTTDWLITGER